MPACTLMPAHRTAVLRTARARWLAGAALLLVATAAQAGEGISLAAAGAGWWSSWQTRLSLQTSSSLARPQLAPGETAGLKIDSLGVFGDYYFAAAPLGRKGAGGFRATTGLMLVDGSTSGLTAGHGLGLGLSQRRSTISALSYADTDGRADAAVPYVGLGYSNIDPSSGWRLAADFGLMATSDPRQVRFGGRGERLQALHEEALRDLRITPVLQLGVSYSF